MFCADQNAICIKVSPDIGRSGMLVKPFAYAHFFLPIFVKLDRALRRISARDEAESQACIHLAKAVLGVPLRRRRLVLIVPVPSSLHFAFK